MVCICAPGGRLLTGTIAHTATEAWRELLDAQPTPQSVREMVLKGWRLVNVSIIPKAWRRKPRK
jgi:hypothetical protein